MVTETVFVKVDHQQFTVAVQIEVDALKDQVNVEGTFYLSGLPKTERIIAEGALHLDNTGTSHSFRVVATTKEYHFKMKSKTSLGFTAVRADINPATGKPYLVH